MMRSKGWSIFHVSMMVLWMVSLISCETAIRNASPVSPTASETMAILSATPYPPTEPLIKVPPFPYPHPEIIPSPVAAYPFPEIVPPPAVAYPYPGVIPSPISSSTPTPTVYLASIQTLSPPQWGTIAAQLSTTPTDADILPFITPQNTPNVLLVPKRNLRITFADRAHGWITGSADWEDRSIDAIASTSDGGQTWQAIPAPPVDENYHRQEFFWGDHNQIQVLFTDAKNGWMYQKWLFRTNDGGQTWKQEHPSGTIIKMGKAKDGTFWALEQVGKDWTLWRVSGDSYIKWSKLGYQFPITMNKVYLSIIDDLHAWMTYWINIQTGDPNPGSHLYRTSDGGKNWERVTAPKPCDFFPLIISPVDFKELWIGCGLFGSAGSGISAVFESPDGGESWYERKYGTLGYFSGITAISKLFVYMTYIRASSITITYDEGETWIESPIACQFYDAKAFFIDETYGWAACDSSINRTVDGGRTWECVDLPGSKVCPP